MKGPTIALAVAIDRSVREHDEWFEEPDDLDRVERAIAAIETIHDPVEAAAVLACRLTRAQGFTEGNKRTGLLLARWLLHRNDVDGALLLPPDAQDHQRLGPEFVSSWLAAGFTVEEMDKLIRHKIFVARSGRYRSSRRGRPNGPDRS